jgi:hypothetical protein
VEAPAEKTAKNADTKNGCTVVDGVAGEGSEQRERAQADHDSKARQRQDNDKKNSAG